MDIKPATVFLLFFIYTLLLYHLLFDTNELWGPGELHNRHSRDTCSVRSNDD